LVEVCNHPSGKQRSLRKVNWENPKGGLAMKRLKFGGVAFLAVALAIAAGGPASADAKGCTTAQGASMAQNCQVVTGSSNYISKWKNFYQPGLATNNICGQDYKFQYKKFGASVISYLYYYQSSGTCYLPYTVQAYTLTFSGYAQQFAPSSKACSTNKWDDYDTWNNYACANIYY